MKADITQLLRSMPNREPPADGWQRLAARQAHRKYVRWGGWFAMAASVAIALVVTADFRDLPGWSVTPGDRADIRPMIVSAPAKRTDRHTEDANVRALQRRSQRMERLLDTFPAPRRVAHADTAGVIAELEDRIAAVDYQLNRAGLSDTGRTAAHAYSTGAMTQRSDLWRRRVEFMDQLVRARFLEAGFEGDGLD